MSYFLDKLLSVFVFPLGFAIFAGLVCLIFIFCGSRKFGGTALLIVLIGLWLVSAPSFASFALRTLEAEYPIISIEETPAADVAIVLGGGIRPPNAYNQHPDFGESSDRLVHALRLWHAGKVKKIMLVGGGNGWGGEKTSEGSAMAQILNDFGITGPSLIVERESRNTFENAVLAHDLWEREQFQTGLLITSASHMKRALGVFSKQGMDLNPVPVDGRAGALVSLFPLSWLPDVRALDQTTNAIREWVGLLVYKFRGQI